MQDIESSALLRRLITALLLAGLLLLGFQVLRPFIVPAIWAGIISFVTWPGYLRMTRWCGGRRTLAALLMTLGVSWQASQPAIGVPQL